MPSSSETNTNNLEDYAQILREKILFGLDLYPYLSPSMLHVFLGTSTSTHVWKPILNQLIGEGLVCEDNVTKTSPHDRTQTYTILRLATNPPKHTTQSVEPVNQ